MIKKLFKKLNGKQQDTIATALAYLVLLIVFLLLLGTIGVWTALSVVAIVGHPVPLWALLWCIFVTFGIVFNN